MDDASSSRFWYVYRYQIVPVWLSSGPVVFLCRGGAGKVFEAAQFSLAWRP